MVAEFKDLDSKYFREHGDELFVSGITETDHPERSGCAAVRPSLAVEGEFDIPVDFLALQNVIDDL